jgi:multidrug efflux pump subunit AcrB
LVTVLWQPEDEERRGKMAGIPHTAADAAEIAQRYRQLYTGDEKPVTIAVPGADSERFAAWRTSMDEQYAEAGTFPVVQGELTYKAPRSVTTFFGS